MKASYWHTVLARRVSRRRTLATSAAVSLGAALLVACGGDDSDGTAGGASTSPSTGASGGGSTGPSGGASGLLYTPQDSSESAVKGGIYTAQTDNIAAFDTLGNATDSTHALHGYSRLVKYRTFEYPETAVPSVDPDAATWEVSPDGLRYTFKIRPELKFDSRSPTDGRAVDSGDVQYSWERYEELNPFNTFLANSADPIAPVMAVTTPDPQTAVFELAFPYAPILAVLAYNRSLAIVPVESEDQYDVKNDMRGSGPWRLSEFVPSSRVSYEPNPDWYDAAKMNFAGLTYYMIPEYATEIAQFKAGNLAVMGEMPQSDILPSKREVRSLLLKRVDSYELAHDFFRFSYLPDSPFLDERVRKAVSMLIDRNLTIETMNATQDFTDEGFSAEMRWNSGIICGEPWWLDPQSSEFGEDSKWFQYNPAEAKQLLSAAGHSSAIKAPFIIRSEGGAVLNREAEIMHGMLTANGDFDMEFQVRDYRADFRANVHYGSDTHEGVAFGFFSSTMPDVDLPLIRWYFSTQDTAGHLAADGKPDAHMDDLIMKQRAEMDNEKRGAILNEFQRYAAKTMYAVMGAGDSKRFELGQPWLGNWGVYRTFAGPYGAPATEIFPHWYINT